jgi:type IV secretion system protein VirD4
VVQGFAPNDLTTADWMSRRAGQTTLVAANSSENLTPATGQRSESMSWTQISCALYLPRELMGFAEGTGLFWLAGMANGVRFFAPPYWKIETCAECAALNPYYEARDEC